MRARIGWRRSGAPLGKRTVWGLRAFVAALAVCVVLTFLFAGATLTLACASAVAAAALLWPVVLGADQQRQVWGLRTEGPVTDRRRRP